MKTSIQFTTIAKFTNFEKAEEYYSAQTTSSIDYKFKQLSLDKFGYEIIRSKFSGTKLRKGFVRKSSQAFHIQSPRWQSIIYIGHCIHSTSLLPNK